MLRLFGFMLTIIFLIINGQRPPTSIWPEPVVEWDQEWFTYDSLMPIVLELPGTNASGPNLTVIATGVLVNPYRVLTSFNAYRYLTNDRNMLRSLKAVMATGRTKIGPGQYEMIYSWPFQFRCGRQIVVTPDEEMPAHLWHGNQDEPNAHLHNPLHDLMVLRLDPQVYRGVDISTTTYHKEHFDKQKINHTYAPGPFKPFFATRNSPNITGWFQIGGLEYTADEMLTEDDIKKFSDRLRVYRRIKVRNYNYEDVKVDCAEYFPPTWGHFICLNNTDNLDSIGSGAVLEYGKRIYGIGSFVMTRVDKSVIAFTDVRPYFRHIWNTCSDYDMSSIEWTVSVLEKASNKDPKQLDEMFENDEIFKDKTGFTWWEMFDRHMTHNRETMQDT